MATATTRDASLSFRLPEEHKQIIEDAAVLAGQSVSDFVVSVLMQSARSLIQERDNTVLSNRDRNAFLALLDKTDAKPNRVLTAAARRYRKHSS